MMNVKEMRVFISMISAIWKIARIMPVIVTRGQIVSGVRIWEDSTGMVLALLNMMNMIDISAIPGKEEKMTLSSVLSHWSERKNEKLVKTKEVNT